MRCYFTDTIERMKYRFDLIRNRQFEIVRPSVRDGEALSNTIHDSH